LKFRLHVIAFSLYFSSLNDYWHQSTCNCLVHTSWGELERCEERAFSPSNCEKVINLNIKPKCVTDFYSQLGLRVWRIIHFIMWWAHKRQTFTLISIKMRIWNFLFKRNRVFKHKVVVSNLHVCSNGIGKMWTSYTFYFSRRILTSTGTRVFNIFFA
jgi:hypothetical protein